MRQELALQLNKYQLISFEEIDSTNKYLKNNYLNLDTNTVVKTNYQTEGKGQFNRSWDSNKGENLLFSILLKDININQIDLIKENVKNSLLDFLLTFNINGVFKIPNDILVNNKKILGILIETKINPSNEAFDYVVIGIGININQQQFNHSNATSLAIINNEEYNIDELLKSFLEIYFK